MPPARAAVSAALVAALVVCAIALATWGVRTGERNRVELSPSFTPPKTVPKVTVDIKDLVKMNPEWAPTAVPTLSSGFNSWMDTLPFGDNFHKHLQEKKDKQIWVEQERMNNPHFLLRRVEANNAYLSSRVTFLDKLVQDRRDTPGDIQIDIVHPGPQGDVGTRGPLGEVGPPGFMGPQGPQGPPGVEGDEGPEGDNGVDGASGEAGDRGAQGPTGPIGLNGVAGLPGPDGPGGDVGSVGPRGPGWPTAGPPGQPGPPGLAGPGGVQGPSGAQGPPGGPTLSPLAISEVDSLSGTQLKSGFINVGAPLYIDEQDITVTSLPAEIAGQPYIMTADSDKGETGSSVLTFTVNRPCYVYILRDSRGTAAKGGEPPAWLSNGFMKLEDQVVGVSDEDMEDMGIYRSGMAMSGMITLGGNADLPSQGFENNYVVVVAPSEEHATEGTGVVALSIPSETGGTEGYEGSMGFTFTVNAPIFIMDLGVFNPTGAAPLPNTLSCRLYNMETGELIAQQSFSQHNRGDGKGGSLFKALRQPVQLPEGFQGVLAADGYGPEFMNGNSEGAAPAWTFNNDGGKVTFGGDALFGAVGAMPDEVAGPPGNRFAAATMRFT